MTVVEVREKKRMGNSRMKKLSDHDLRELHQEGLMDIEIAEIIGVAISTVNKRRRSMGLPKNRQHSRTAKRFTVYDGENGECIMEGTVREIAEKLHIAESTVYFYARCTKYEMPCRYAVHRIDEASLGDCE